MPVLAASVRALVTPVTRTSIASHQVSMVAHSRSVSGMSAASTKAPKRILFSCASARIRVSSWLRQGRVGGQPAALGRRVHADTGSVVALVGQRGQPEEGGRGVQRAEEAGGAGGGEVMRSPRLHAFKRLRTRYEQRADIHLDLLQLARAPELLPPPPGHSGMGCYGAPR
jgi:hypothetical protein